jgi:hypothetical protein
LVLSRVSMRPIANAEQLSVRSLRPMPQDNTNPQPKMIGFENLLNMTDKDRAQAVWDKAMWPEAKEHMEKIMAFGYYNIGSLDRQQEIWDRATGRGG